MYIVVQTSPSEEIDLPKSAHDEYGKGYICIAESTVHDLHGPPLTGQSLFTCRVAGDQIELN